ncbi:hypothetical protein HDU96_004101, partial [Phlyctochytrium bullatum]
PTAQGSAPWVATGKCHRISTAGGTLLQGANAQGVRRFATHPASHCANIKGEGHPPWGDKKKSIPHPPSDLNQRTLSKQPPPSLKMSSSPNNNGRGGSSNGSTSKPPILLEGSENFPEYKGYITDYAASMRAAYLLDPGAVPKTEADFAAEMAERMDTLRQRFEGEYEDLEVESKLPLASMITMAIAEQAKPTALLLHMKACMKPHIAAMFANVHSPSELWAELKHLYEKVALASAHETASTFRNLRFEDSMSIGAFAEKFSTLRSNLLLLGHDDASPHNAVTILIHAFESNLTQQNVCTNLKLAVGTAEVMRGNGRYQESNLKDGIQFLFSMQNNSKKSKGRGSVNATEKKAGSRRPKSQVKGQKKEKDPNKCGICSGKHATRECRKCRTCKKEGHFAAQCPQKKDKETSSNSNTSGEVNVLQAVVTELDVPESTLTHVSSSGSENAAEQTLAVVVATRTSTPSTVTNPLESIDSHEADT